VDQFAWPLALITVGGLEPESPELAHPDPREDPRDRRQRPIEQLGDLRASEPQPAQRGDHLDGLLGGAIGDHARRRRAIHQARQPLGSVASEPLRARALPAGVGGAVAAGWPVIAVAGTVMAIDMAAQRQQLARQRPVETILGRLSRSASRRGHGPR
jgi:hypothetical protein